MKLIVDQKQSRVASCATFSDVTVLIDLCMLDESVKEGDLIFFKAGKWKVDEEATSMRTHYVKKLMANVFED